MTYIHSIEALADPTRRALIEQLHKEPSSVSDLTKVVSVSQPAVSQHLAVLKQAGLVSVEKVGNKRIYRLAAEGLIAVRNYIDQLWDEALNSYQKAAIDISKGEKND